MSEVQTVSATVHEVAHSKLHDRQKIQETSAAGDNASDQPKPKDRNTEEVEAESISYAVCQYFGIQTGENSFGYIASWSKDKDLKELRASLETINKTSCELINDIERNYKEICKERGIDLNAQKKKLFRWFCRQQENRQSPLPANMSCMHRQFVSKPFQKQRFRRKLPNTRIKSCTMTSRIWFSFGGTETGKMGTGRRNGDGSGQWRCPGCR